MNEFITDTRLLEILEENNFNQTASARFLASTFGKGLVDYEKFRYHIKRRIDLCEFINEANKRYKTEKDKEKFDKLHPLIKQQFCKIRNKEIELRSLNPGTHTLIQLICCKCGEVFQSKVKDLQNNLERAKNKEVTGCPYCANKTVNKSNSFGACYPELAKHWDYEKNKGVTPFDVLPGRDEKFYFICEFGHSFDSLLYNITHKQRGRWCPYCKLTGTSYLEIILYFELHYIFGDLVIWNKISKFAKINYGVECDVLLIHPVVGKICIELDSTFHRTQERINNDLKKNQILESFGIKVLRLRHDKLIKLSESDVFFNDDQDDKSIISALFLSLQQFSGFSSNEIEKIKNYIKCPSLANLEKIKNCHRYLLEHTSYDNKFLDTRPDLEKYWNVEKNLPYSPSFFTSGSHFPAYWKCPDCNVEDQIIVREMVKRKNPCIPCYEKNRKIVEYQDSISSRFPELLKLWDWKKNQKLGLDPASINPWSVIEAFWVCPFDHPYSAPIKSISDTHKSGNSGCPACKYNQNLIDLDGNYVSVAGLVKKIKLENKKNVIHLNSTLSLVKNGFKALHCRAFAMLSRADKLAADLTTKNDPITELEHYLKKSILSIFSERIEPELQRLERAIIQCKGNVSRAEKLLGLRKSYINDFCRKRGIKIPK
jgi:thiamine pyrophosphokinase